MNFSKCECQSAGWCPIFKTKMGNIPPNFSWCQNATEQQRTAFFNSMNKSVRIIHKASNDNDVDVMNFYDELPEQKNNRAICVIASDDKSLELLKITRSRIISYAKKCNADYIELTGDQIPSYPIYNKFRLYQVTQKYEKTLYVDCDIVIKYNAPNIFEITPDDKISAFDEFSGYAKDLKDNWAKSELDRAAVKLNLPAKQNTMLNSGFFVVPKSCASYYKQPEIPHYKSWVFDQVYLTLATPESKINRLEKKWNNTYDLSSFSDNIHCSYINHINTAGKTEKQEERKKLLELLLKDEMSPSMYAVDTRLPKIVTSLSYKAASLTRQAKAIESWKQQGFYIISCNTHDEIIKLKEFYKLVDEFREIEIVRAKGFKPTPNIYDLCAVANSINETIILINSDIEVTRKNTILEAIGSLKEKQLVIGIRQNYDDKQASRERYGIDFYVITPEIARSLPRLEQRIGMPFWDYWVVAHFFVKNYEIKLLDDNFLIHRIHDLNWSQEEWHTGHGNFKNYYNDTIGSIIGYGYDFRSCLGNGPDRYHTLIYDHIPKTAGTSIAEWICLPQCAHDFRDKSLRYISNNIHDAQYFIDNLPLHKKQILRFISGHYVWPIIDHCNKNRFIFTTIRDPLDRFISHLSFDIQKNGLIVDDISAYIRNFAEHYFSVYRNHMTCNGTVDWKSRIDKYDYIEDYNQTAAISKTIRLAFPNQISKPLNLKLNECPSKVQLSSQDLDFIKNGLEQEYEIYEYMKDKKHAINEETLKKLTSGIHQYVNYYDNKFFETDVEALKYLGFYEK